VFGVEGGKADFQKFPKGGNPRRQVFEILGKKIKIKLQISQKIGETRTCLNFRTWLSPYAPCKPMPKIQG